VKEPAFIAGEVRRIDEGLLSSRLENGEWRTCEWCGELFSVLWSRPSARRRGQRSELTFDSRLNRDYDMNGLQTLSKRYKRDPEAWDLMLPVRDPSGRRGDRSARFCCAYCQQQPHRTSTQKLRPWQGDLVDREEAELIVGELGLDAGGIDVRGLRGGDSIDVQETVLYKIMKGYWRVCWNPQCRTRPRELVCCDHRRWHYRLGARGTVIGLTCEDGDRIVGLLHLGYQPRSVSDGWRSCGATCRQALSRQN
jgi:hypothetical protein